MSTLITTEEEHCGYNFNVIKKNYKVRIKTTYKIGNITDRLFIEHIEWINKENIDDDAWFLNQDWRGGTWSLIYSFYNKIDAVAFVLRWI